MKDELRDTYGIKPLSQTDTEIVAIWIGVYIDQGLSLFEAITKCISILEGAYTFVLISVLEPDAMYIIKNTGTVVIGVSKGLQTIESDQIQKIQEDEETKGDEAQSAQSSPNNHIF